MADNRYDKAKISEELCFKAALVFAFTNGENKQLLMNAAKIAETAAASAADKASMEISVALCCVAALINDKAVELYQKERGNQNAKT